MLVDDGKIAAVFTADARPLPKGLIPTDLGDALIAPGSIDLHIHGSAGFDVMDDSDQALPAIERFLVRHGVTSYCPTTVTAPLDKTLGALDRLASAIEKAQSHAQDGTGRACPVGIHLEGPFISHVRRGVHPPEHLLPPTLAAFDRFWNAARGQIRVLTIAPELPGAGEVIAAAAQRGVCVSMGHSDADANSTLRGIDAGARHATHTFNAMRPLQHRGSGILGTVLTDDRISADLIADGVHLDPAIVKLIAQAKGPEQTVLITDATAATGMPEGRFRLGEIDVQVKDGKVTADGVIAGSILTMDQAVRNLARFTGWSLPQAVAAASRNPARVLRLKDKGQLAPGTDADFVALTPAGDVLRTFIAGRECS